MPAEISHQGTFFMGAKNGRAAGGFAENEEADRMTTNDTLSFVVIPGTSFALDDHK
jgi:hypothetical protein